MQNETQGRGFGTRPVSYWPKFVTELGAADKRNVRKKLLAAAMERAAPQPLGSCRMRSPIMFFCTGEVPPAIVMLSL